MQTPVVAGERDVVIDSGTSLCYVPNSVAEGVAGLFVPAADYDYSVDAWFVNCDAQAPVFGVSIARKIFYVNPEDLIIDLGTGGNQCVMGVQPNFNGLSILGGTWLKNVLAVFDVGAQQMRFAARQWTSVVE